MDKTVLTLAVDSSQVGTAAAAFDRMVNAGNAAATSAGRVTSATLAEGRAISQTLIPALNTGINRTRTLEETQRALGLDASRQIGQQPVAARTVVSSAPRDALTGASAPTAPAIVRAVPSALPGTATQAPSVGSAGIGQLTTAAAGTRSVLDILTTAANNNRAALVQLNQTAQETARTFRQLNATPITLVAPQGLSAISTALNAAQQASPNTLRAVAEAMSATAAQATLAAAAVTEANRAISATPRITATSAAPVAQTPLVAQPIVSAADGQRIPTSTGISTAQLGADASRAQTAVERLTSAARTQRSALAELAPAAAATAGSYRQLAAAPIRLAAPQELSAAAAALAAVATQANNARVSITALNTATPVATPARAAASAGAAVVGRQAQAIVAPTVAAGEAARLSTAQLQGLTHSVHSFVDMVVAGQSPIKAFGLEAARLTGTFGTVGGTFRAITSLFTPVRVAVGGVVAAVGALAYAYYEGAKQSKAFADAVVLSGNYAGQTEGKLNALTREIANHGQATAGAAREAAQALISSGQVGPQVFAAATEAVTLYAQATNKTTEDVVKDFAEMARSPSKWAEEHNRALNFITAAQYDAIKAFEDAGKAADAQGIIYEALNERLRKLDPNLGTIERTLRSVKGAWSNFWDAAYDIGRTETIEGKIAGLDAKIREAHSSGNPFAPAPQSRTAQLAKENQSNPEYELQDLLAGKARKDADAANEATDREVQKAGIAAKAVVDGYLKRGKAASAYKEALDKLNRSFKDQQAAGTPVSAADQKVALTELKKEFTPAKGAGAGEAQQVLRAQLETDIKGIKDALDREKERLSFQQHYLDGVYQAGQISLKDFYDRRRATIAEGVDAELAELDKETARLQKYQKATKDPSEKVVTQTRINEVAAQKEKVSTAASHDVVLVNQEEAASFKALGEQVINYRANLLQMQGDEAGAAALRAQTVVANARVLAAQANALPGTPKVDVEALARAIAITDQFNEVQRQTSLLAANSSRAEEAYALAAEQSGKSLADTEHGIYAVRANELEQLGALAAKAKELADASTDPRIKSFASDLALEYAKAANVIDPALNRLRDANKQLAAGLAQSVSNAPTAFADAYNQRRSSNSGESRGKTALVALNEAVVQPMAKQVFDTVNKLLITDPLQKYLEGQLKGLTEGDGALAGFFKDALGIKADPKEQALLQQTAAITASSSALDVLTAAAQNAASALGKSGPGAATSNEQGVDQAGTIRFGTTSHSSPVGSELASAQVDATQSLTTFDKDATASASDVMKLANAAGVGGDSMARLPGIIGLFQSAVAAMSTSSASGGSGGGIFGAIAGLFGKGSGVASSADYASLDLLAEAGGGYIAGPGTGKSDSIPARLSNGEFVMPAEQTKKFRPMLEQMRAGDVFAKAPRYHTGGIVGQKPDGVRGALAAATLKAGEVPAVLMKQEEVLRRDDPRHRDNLGMSIVARILAESKSSKHSVSKEAKTSESRSTVSTLLQSIAGGKGEGESSANVLGGLLDRLGVKSEPESAVASAVKVRGARELGGPVSPGGMYRVNEKGPELLEVAGKQYLMMGGQPGHVEASGAGKGQGGASHIHVQVTAQPGMSRATAQQQGVQIARGIELSMRRNG